MLMVIFLEKHVFKVRSLNIYYYVKIKVVLVEYNSTLSAGSVRTIVHPNIIITIDSMKVKVTCTFHINYQDIISPGEVVCLRTLMTPTLSRITFSFKRETFRWPPPIYKKTLPPCNCRLRHFIRLMISIFFLLLHLPIQLV